MSHMVSPDIAALKRYRVKGTSNLYSIGHDSGVVSFYSQQSRAFHLATLLANCYTEAQRSDLKFGVLGGGIAGVTVWLALRFLAFKNVKLFEATHDLLTRQAECEHRFAHPSINEWPLVGGGIRPFRSTTSWPFLNWYGDTTKSVIEQLRNDPFLKSAIAKAKEDGSFACHHIIRSVNESKEVDPSHPIVLVAYDAPEDSRTVPFNVVISCLGYRYEKDLEYSASRSYWWNDHIPNYVTDTHEFAEHTKYVSGTGDGGLIDCIRFAAAHNLPRTKNIAMEIVAWARPSKYKTLNDEWPLAEIDKTSKIEKAIGQKLLNQRNGGALTKDFVDELFHELFTNVQFYKLFCNKERLKKIKLVTRDGKIYGSRSSIVNQILITFLRTISADKIIVKGELKADGGLQIAVKDGCEHLVDKANDKVVVVVRHGADPQLNSVLDSKAELEDPPSADSSVF